MIQSLLFPFLPRRRRRRPASSVLGERETHTGRSIISEAHSPVVCVAPCATRSRDYVSRFIWPVDFPAVGSRCVFVYTITTTASFTYETVQFILLLYWKSW